jgi:hypothetical protein
MTPSNMDLVLPIARPTPPESCHRDFARCLPNGSRPWIGPSGEIGLLRLSGGLERKLFAHGSRRVAYSLDCACKLLLCHTKMLGPVPELIFAIEDNLTAVTGDACVSFHDLYFLGSCDGSIDCCELMPPRHVDLLSASSVSVWSGAMQADLGVSGRSARLVTAAPPRFPGAGQMIPVDLRD